MVVGRRPLVWLYLLTGEAASHSCSELAEFLEIYLQHSSQSFSPSNGPWTPSRVLAYIVLPLLPELRVINSELAKKRCVQCGVVRTSDVHAQMCMALRTRFSTGPAAAVVQAAARALDSLCDTREEYAMLVEALGTFAVRA